MSAPDYDAIVEAEEFAGGPMVAPRMNVPDTRDESEIRAGVHAVAHMPGWSEIVRGIDRYTHLPTRERAAVVWVAARHGLGGHHCELVDLDFIEIRPGVTP